MTSILIVWAAASAFMFVIMFVLPGLDRNVRPTVNSRKITAPAIKSNNAAHAAA